MNLYEICKALDVWALKYRNDESEDALAELAALELSYDEKLGNIARMIQNWEAEAAALKAEAVRLSEKRMSIAGKIERLKNYVGLALGEGNGWSDGVLAFKWHKGERVDVDEKQLPENYWRVVTKREPDKAGLKQLLKTGESVPGAELIKTYSLAVK